MKQQQAESSYSQEVVIKQHLRKQLSIFRSGWLSQNGWKNLLHDKDEHKLLPQGSVHDMKNKCKYIATLMP